ncbi:hypothetical protein DFH09DRAFT_1087450 [Mycena vulgaris]|nr:hypothetical protein DFH09DRAFT_1087450 [Mycena vulgaris]
MNAPTNSPTPAQELAALVAKVAALSKLALDMTKLTMDINDAVPGVIASQVTQAVDVLTPTAPQFMHGTARTPDQMDALFPPGVGDHQLWYVVIVGREPGLYNSSVAADAEVNGVPGQFRQKKASRVEALAFYRNRYNDSAVAKISEVIVAPATVTVAPAPAPVVAAAVAQ